MIDKVAILAEVYERSRIRREAQLPLLDLRAEYESALAERAWEEAYEEFYKFYKPAREEYENRLWQKLENRHRRQWRKGPDYRIQRIGVGSWGNHRHIRRVLDRIVRMRSGKTRPPIWMSKNLVSYGQDGKS